MPASLTEVDEFHQEIEMSRLVIQIAMNLKKIIEKYLQSVLVFIEHWQFFLDGLLVLGKETPHFPRCVCFPSLASFRFLMDLNTDYSILEKKSKQNYRTYTIFTLSVPLSSVPLRVGSQHKQELHAQDVPQRHNQQSENLTLLR